MYTKDSGLVKVWVSLIVVGAFNLDNVPDIYNLRNTVEELLNERTEN